ncbi:MAG: hypothetical protein QOD87_1918 [Pseudonocardiales bacterium]|jgi:hypothetical protein|nr:hypothetical protein [Pseudonocardiales bacterium]MDQ1749156.1 hypothetical protein [Pseudonocardiales bacterium]
MVTEVDRSAHPLTAEDRCDRCSARAVVQTVMLGGGALLWCGHHFSTYADALNGLGAEIVCDLRSRETA